MANPIRITDSQFDNAKIIAAHNQRIAAKVAELAEMLGGPSSQISLPAVVPAIPGTVVRVGKGRGFVVEDRQERLIITAAHCLPRLPPPMNFSYTEERTYGKLVGPLGKRRTVWAECLFVDPIADIAVLGPPNGQVLFDEYSAYDALVEAATAFPLAPAPRRGEAWMLSLGGVWNRCSVEHAGGPLRVTGGESTPACPAPLSFSATVPQLD